MFNATLTERIEITPELLILRVKPDAGVPTFEPGQYVAIGLPGSAPRPQTFPPEDQPPALDKLIKRAYSIGSPPSERGYLEFYVAIVPIGALTSRLVTLRPGDRLNVAPKITGHFTLHDVPDGRNIILVATGTGLAPYMSMIRLAHTWERFENISILHGVRYERDLAYREEILSLQGQRKGLKYFPYVSREDSADGTFERGYVQHVFLSGKLETVPERDHIFMCGNPAMIEDLEGLLVKRGYVVHTKKHPGSLHVEKYW